MDIERSGWTKSAMVDAVPRPLRPDAVADQVRELLVGGAGARSERRSVSSIANRQLRNAPSAVSRSRLHVSQKGSVTARDHADRARRPSANR